MFAGDGKHKEVEVTVSFYGGTAWWIKFSNTKVRQALTPELWAKCKPLRVK